MADSQAQSPEQAARFGHHFANIPVHPPAIQAPAPVQPKQMTGDHPLSSAEQRPNQTGLPDHLKAGIENLSGLAMDDVRVHYNSPKPAQLQALAYTQGTDIHVAPGQDRHLAHEAWHVVQQAQGRVKATMQMKDAVAVNDDQELEREADLMAGTAAQPAAGVAQRQEGESPQSALGGSAEDVVQRVLVNAPALAADRATMNGLPNADPNDMGNTGQPAAYVAPAYVIHTAAADGGGWTASVVKVTAADEGVNFSRYLGAGIHSTGLMAAGGGLGMYAPGPGNREIYGEVTAAIANDNRDAEQEHVDDFLRAYAITLDVAEQAIDAAVLASPFPPQANAAAAQATAEAFMNAQIAALTAALGATPFLITAPLGPIYAAKFHQSMARDGLGWHTFRPNMAAPSTSLAAWVHWARYLGAHDVRVIQHGPTFSVGITPAAVQIT